MDRRRFLAHASLCAAAAVLPSFALADLLALPRRGGKPVRVRGAVRSRGKGLAGVAVSDGLSIVTTARDGTYELVTTADRATVQVSIPRGYRIPVSPTGTARFFAPVVPNAHAEASASFELEPLAASDEKHTVFVLGDIQTQDADEMRWFHEQSVPDVIAQRASLGDREVFGISAGDLVYDRLHLFPDYERAVKKLGIPFFQVVGNHDLDREARVDEGSTTTFERTFGPRYYSFDRGAVHYVVLDDVFWHGTGYIGYLELDQLAWLAADLALVERGRTVIVVQHIPALGTRHERDGLSAPDPSRALTNRDALYRLLEPFRAHVLAGHMHESEHRWDGAVHEHVVGATCGAWWSGPICADGTPNGYAIYDIAGDDVKWRFKATGLAIDQQLRAYPRATDGMLVNAWDWDPSWVVTWFEDGERRGRMTPRAGRDPLSVELHEGPLKPPRRPWVDPYVTNHLLYAPASRTARTITIEAVDRFGRTYSTTA